MRIILMLFISVLISACAGDPIQRQPEIQVEVVTHKMSLQLQGKTLSSKDKAAVADFIYRLGNPSAMRVRIDIHTRRGAKVVPGLKGQLKQQAVYPSQVIAQYAALPASKADLTLIVETYRSVAQRCQAGKAPITIGNSFKNSSNFGCANANALAQMVANPRDLIVGESLGATEGRKAVSTLDSYYSSGTYKTSPTSPKDGVMAGQGK
ncbi:CpaD family pilus assembly lipoprotein [Photobacterium alginatilyticum]|uniref:CpaD family pilus assembly lipoprotein n=1 Tax=Photobacterium alginatilyticum TaxID=1775171 RepID=UPI0040695335